MALRSYLARPDHRSPGDRPSLGSQIDWSHPANAGLKLRYLLNEGGGAPTDLVSGSPVAVVGSPTWQNGPFGPQVGSFATTSYYAIDPPSQVLYNGTFPYWAAAMFVNTNTAAQVPFCVASSSNSQPMIQAQINNGGSGRLFVLIRNDTGTSASFTATGLPLNDGQPHVVCVYSTSPSNHFSMLDGVVVASSTATVPTPFTTNYMTLGCFRGITNSAPFLGSILAAAFGYGALPDFATLARDLYAGIDAPTTRRIVSFASIVSPVFRRKLSPGRIGSRSVA